MLENGLARAVLKGILWKRREDGYVKKQRGPKVIRHGGRKSFGTKVFGCEAEVGLHVVHQRTGTRREGDKVVLCGQRCGKSGVYAVERGCRGEPWYFREEERKVAARRSCC